MTKKKSITLLADQVIEALSDFELDQLAKIMDLLHDEEEGMNLSMLDGYFTAIAIGPTEGLPTDWFSWVVENIDRFNEVSVGEQVLALMMRHYHHLKYRLCVDNPPVFEPIYLYRPDQEQPWVADWCHGFMAGVQSTVDDWDASGDGVFSGIELLVGMSTLPPPDEPMLELVEGMSDEDEVYYNAQQKAVLALDDYHKQIDPLAGWDVLIEMLVFMIRDHFLHPEVSQTCPCGSGKAFEACCGTRDRKLH